MKTMSLMASRQNVIQQFEKSLSRGKFKNVHVNQSSGVISAERRTLFFGRRNYKVSLTIKQIDDTITNVELKVNPHHVNPSISDEQNELRLENRLLSYLR